MDGGGVLRTTSMAALTSERPRPASVAGSRHAPWLATGAVCVGAFMGQLDASIASLALPAIGRDFHAGLQVVQWVALAYLLTLVALVAPVGRWSDAYGRKLFYLYGFVVFTAGSAACAGPSCGRRRGTARCGCGILRTLGRGQITERLGPP